MSPISSAKCLAFISKEYLVVLNQLEREGCDRFHAWVDSFHQRVDNFQGSLEAIERSLVRHGYGARR